MRKTNIDDFYMYGITRYRKWSTVFVLSFVSPATVEIQGEVIYIL